MHRYGRHKLGHSQIFNTNWYFIILHWLSNLTRKICSESNNKRILKIDQFVAKLSTSVECLLFLTHSVLHIWVVTFGSEAKYCNEVNVPIVNVVILYKKTANITVSAVVHTLLIATSHSYGKSKFDPQNPNPLTDYDKTMQHLLRARDKHVHQNLYNSAIREPNTWNIWPYLFYFYSYFFLGLDYWSGWIFLRTMAGSKRAESHKGVLLWGPTNG